MADSRVFPDPVPTTVRSGAGTITRIRLENFMCHSNLQIELCPDVNFITGQNGSGKSAILTALCVAFGSRAKGTQRASTLKDFIKTGCSYAVVEVEIKNEGEEAFKPQIYGSAIVIERRITHSANSTTLKNYRGRKVASRKDELQELVEHYNIDVENPCVIMSQDKSREFLHSGNDKDKFKFFYKATHLQQVNDLLQSIDEQLRSANLLVDELEASIKPIERELVQLLGKIKNMEHIEEISQQVQLLKKKLAWSWVYDVDKQLQELSAKIEKLNDRIPKCQDKIDWNLRKVESLTDCFTKKKSQIAQMVQKTSEMRKEEDQLKHSLELAKKETMELEEMHGRQTNQVLNMVKRVKSLEQQVQDVQEQHAKNTQDEESEIEEKLKELQLAIDAANSTISRLKGDEGALLDWVSKRVNEITKLTEEIDSYVKKDMDIRSHIHELRKRSSNKVTAFGGDRVTQLLEVIERHYQRFKKPPIGPIGVHVSLAGGDKWALAVEHAIGRLLNAFIVTSHKDSLLLRSCAAEAKYSNLQIIIYDFSRPRLAMPSHMLPQTSHPTTLSVLKSDNDTVLNVLVDMGNAERQVLVDDYDSGKAVAFDRRVLNLKEVFTLEGYKMFSRGSVQTVLPPNKRLRTGRLCSSYDDQIKNLGEESFSIKKEAEECRKRKRDVETDLENLRQTLRDVKERRLNAERDLASKKLELEDIKRSHVPETSLSTASTVGDLHQEILNIQARIQEKENSLEILSVRMREAQEKAEDLKLSFKHFCESAKQEFDAFEKAEKELMEIEENLKSAKAVFYFFSPCLVFFTWIISMAACSNVQLLQEKNHYEGVMKTKVLPDIREAEAQNRVLEENRRDNCRKASIICPESDIEALGAWDGSSPEQLSAQLSRLNHRLKNESQRYSESIDDLRMLYEKKGRKIQRKQKAYKSFREKLKVCQDALNLRWKKFHANKHDLKLELTWKFNDNLGRKGVSGNIKVDYEEKTLSVGVKMPQDPSKSHVRDTRGLSGGERSFSTLCFALALHKMIEVPFRGMDEFDVFMDAVSRKISLETLVEFALKRQSQWIFITPHDISTVIQDNRIKKQQLAAPRS